MPNQYFPDQQITIKRKVTIFIKETHEEYKANLYLNQDRIYLYAYTNKTGEDLKKEFNTSKRYTISTKEKIDYFDKKFIHLIDCQYLHHDAEIYLGSATLLQSFTTKNVLCSDSEKLYEDYDLIELRSGKLNKLFNIDTISKGGGISNHVTAQLTEFCYKGSNRLAYDFECQESKHNARIRIGGHYTVDQYKTENSVGFTVHLQPAISIKTKFKLQEIGNLINCYIGFFDFLLRDYCNIDSIVISGKHGAKYTFILSRFIVLNGNDSRNSNLPLQMGSKLPALFNKWQKLYFQDAEIAQRIRAFWKYQNVTIDSKFIQVCSFFEYIMRSKYLSEYLETDDFKKDLKKKN